MVKENRNTPQTISEVENVHQSSAISHVPAGQMTRYIRSTYDNGESKHAGSKSDKARLARAKKEKKKKLRR